jgi:hypothetical protein
MLKGGGARLRPVDFRQNVGSISVDGDGTYSANRSRLRGRLATARLGATCRTASLWQESFSGVREEIDVVPE